MIGTISIAEFYKSHTELRTPEKINTNKELGHFNVFHREMFCGKPVSYSRRDFYKITLLIGNGKMYYADKAIDIDSNALLFSNPNIPYSWEPSSKMQSGYCCLFTEEFIADRRTIAFRDLPMYKPGGEPVYFVDDKITEIISGIFDKMIEEIASDYIYKYDLLRNYTDLIIHHALKLKPADSFYKHTNASTRIASLFIELLERQFPIDSPERILKLKAPKDYADNLSVHVNHLNRAVKETTGKTTTELISARITKEAKSLLIHTDWNISEIAYSLGFEYPTYFNNFFKKHTNLTPKSVRQ
jgi:AraC-like DNA-binding protein